MWETVSRERQAENETLPKGLPFDPMNIGRFCKRLEIHSSLSSTSWRAAARATFNAKLTLKFNELPDRGCVGLGEESEFLSSKYLSELHETSYICSSEPESSCTSTRLRFRSFVPPNSALFLRSFLANSRLLPPNEAWERGKGHAWPFLGHTPTTGVCLHPLH